MDSSRDWRLVLLILLITWLLGAGIVRYFNAFLASCQLPIIKTEVSPLPDDTSVSVFIAEKLPCAAYYVALLVIWLHNTAE